MRTPLVATVAAVTVVGALASGPATAAPAAEATTRTCASLGTPPNLPRPYAARLVKAWMAGDRFAANCYAVPRVGALLFGESAKTPATWRWVAEAGGPDEDFRAEIFRNGAGAELQVFVRLSDGSNTWDRAFAVYLSGGNGRVSTYADKLIRAWGRGDRATALRFGTAKAVNALWSFTGGAGGSCWERTRTGATVYAVTVDYRCGSDFMTLTINPSAAAAGTPQAVTAAAGYLP